jgi:hypothetical protein
MASVRWANSFCELVETEYVFAIPASWLSSDGAALAYGHLSRLPRQAGRHDFSIIPAITE